MRRKMNKTIKHKGKTIKRTFGSSLIITLIYKSLKLPEAAIASPC